MLDWLVATVKFVRTSTKVRRGPRTRLSYNPTATNETQARPLSRCQLRYKFTPIVCPPSQSPPPRKTTEWGPQGSWTAGQELLSLSLSLSQRSLLKKKQRQCRWFFKDISPLQLPHQSTPSNCVCLYPTATSLLSQERDHQLTGLLLFETSFKLPFIFLKKKVIIITS